ncbi:MAG TPA: 5-dehydro-4-deoxyglucarate dehydratase [Chloroflexota bacterium]|nr:5-dehydro-4-deoxyglucarate dehydratase [Chloroflexota bacterium]
MARSKTSPNDLKTLLNGAIAFPVTPYASDGSVDLAAVRANAEWLPDGGVCAVVAPSGTGELFGLSPDECTAVTEATVDAMNGRIPVIAGVGFGPRVAADMARRAEEVGADGILVLPPYYGQPDPQGLIDYYGAVGAATSLGIMPYARDAAAFTPDLVEKLAQEVPNTIAFKDGRGDVRLFQRIREHVNERAGPDRLIWLAGVGDDLVAPYFAVGATGFTSSVACFWPELSRDLYDAAQSGDYERLRRLQAEKIRPIYDLRQRRRGFEVSMMKAAMEILGHRAGPVRPPLGSLDERDRSDLEEVLERIGAPKASGRTS